MCRQQILKGYNLFCTPRDGEVVHEFFFGPWWRERGGWWYEHGPQSFQFSLQDLLSTRYPISDRAVARNSFCHSSLSLNSVILALIQPINHLSVLLYSVFLPLFLLLHLSIHPPIHPSLLFSILPSLFLSLPSSIHTIPPSNPHIYPLIYP